MKLITTIKTHDSLLGKFFEYGASDEIIQNAINGNWKDFYQPKTSQRSTQYDQMVQQGQISGKTAGTLVAAEGFLRGGQ